MVDPWNPTDDEIRIWAYTENVLCPVQDWDLAITDTHRMNLILELAEDASCPNQEFFLGCLYLYVGDAIRSQWRRPQLNHVVQLIDQGAASTNAHLRLWANEARELMERPQSFRYDLWCDGRLAAKNYAANLG